jgi:hypothetical protein
MGLVMLFDRREVVSIDAEGADLVTNTGAKQRYRRRPFPVNTVALWDVDHETRAALVPGNRLEQDDLTPPEGA